MDLPSHRIKPLQPSHMQWIRSNYKPLFKVHDDAMLRRLALIPFAFRIPADKRIERFEDVLLKERSGILNWLIDGWEFYQKEGLNPYPEAVSAAMNEYTLECDTLKQFIEEYYIEVPGAVTLMKDCTAKYNDWCKLNHYPPSNSRTLANELRNGGWEVAVAAHNALIIRGIGIKDAP